MSSVILVAKLPEGNMVETCVNSAIKVVGTRKFLHRATDNRNVVLMYTALTNEGLGQDYVDVMNKEVAVLYGKIVDYMKEHRDELKLNFYNCFRLYPSLGEGLPCNIQSELGFSDALQYDKLVQFVKEQIRGTTILFEKSKFATETEAVYAGRNWELKIHMPFANSSSRGECLGILLGLLQVHGDRPVLNDLFKKAMSLRAKMRRLRAPGADDGVARRIETAVERLPTHVKRLKCVRYGVQLECCACSIYIDNPTLVQSKFVKGGGLEIEDFACVSDYSVKEFEHAVLYRDRDEECSKYSGEECSNMLLQDLERLENALDIAADFRREEEEDTDDDY